MTKEEFFKKLSNFRKVLNEQDWTLDGYNDKQDYAFLSHRKMKNNVSKALVEAGLEWTVSYSEWSKEPEIGMMKQHYIVKAEATVYDTGSSESVSFTAFGEGADSGDKGMSKAQTNAFKTLIASTFMVSELDESGEEIAESNDSIKAEARSGYEAKQEMTKAKVVRQATAVKTDAPKTKAEAVEGVISDTQKKVLDKIVMKARTLSETELVKFGTLIDIESDYSNVKTAEDAMRFISAYQGIMRCP